MNNKCGIINKFGREILPCKYDTLILCEEEGVIIAELNDRWGLFSLSGEEIIPCKYNELYEFTDGLALVNSEGKYGFIDNKGKEVIPCIYDDASPFHEGMARVGEGDGLDRKYGYVNREGKEVIPCKYFCSSNFSEGLASVCFYDGRQDFVIDKKGNVIFNSEHRILGVFDQGVAIIESNDKYGLIDKTGNVVVSCIYDEIGSFNHGIAKVWKSPFADRIPDIILPSIDELNRRIRSSDTNPVCLLDQDPFVFAIYRREEGYDVDAAYCFQQYCEEDEDLYERYEDCFKKEQVLSGTTSIKEVISGIKTYMDSIEKQREEELTALVNDAAEGYDGELTCSLIAEKIAPKIIDAVASEDHSSNAVFFKYNKSFIDKCEKDLWAVKEELYIAIEQLVKNNPVWKEAEELYRESPDDLSLQLEIRWFDDSLPIMIEGTMLYYHMETYIPMQNLKAPYCYYEGALKSRLAHRNRCSYEKYKGTKKPITFYKLDYCGEYCEKEYLIPDDNASIMEDNLLTGLIVSFSSLFKNNNQRLHRLAEHLLDDWLE